MAQQGAKPRIAVFSGPTATIQNSAPLITSNKARAKYGLPLREGRFDAIRPQRLAAPATVYIRQFSAHPLEEDSGELYGPPDGYLNAAGTFSTQRRGAEDVPVYEVTLNPEDGLYLLPYMARQANGQAWEDECAFPGAPPEASRQTFFPDAARIFEEIDRFGLDGDGRNNLLSAKADFDFYRPLPSAGYKKGDPEQGIPPEALGRDWFPYRPSHLRQDPPRGALARATKVVQRALGSGRYAGGLWLEGSPNMEESVYWLNLLLDAPLPLVGLTSQRPHGTLGNEGDWNIVDAVDYVLSRIWAGDDGRDTVGAVAILDEQVFTAREVQKGDARPGGYVTTGGHGGIVASMGQPGPPVLTFRPARRHTWRSAVNLTCLPGEVPGLQGAVSIKNGEGDLLAEAIPEVRMVKTARYLPESGSHDPDSEVEVLARIEKNLRDAPLAGFVGEGTAPFGRFVRPMDAALERAVFSGMPVVAVGRGNAEGMVPPVASGLFIAGSNLTANKARLLLMASLLKLGALPQAKDPRSPTDAEREAVKRKVAEYQAIFDSH